MLLAETVLLEFKFPAVPRLWTPFVGLLVPAGPMIELEIVLLLLPPATVLVLNKMLPPAVPAATVADPKTLTFVTVSLVAPLINRIVLVPAVADTVVFDTVSELPPVFNPLNVT